MQRLDQDTIHQEISRLDNLPTLPAVAVELIHRWNDPDLTVNSIIDLLSCDVPLSAKVLQVANSAKNRFRNEITSLHHAATLLGLNTLRCLTLGVSVLESFSDHKAEWAKEIDLDEFWRHSLAVAVAAEMLASRLGYATPEEAFLAGLLHDIGKFGLLATIPQDYVQVLRKASTGDKTLLDYEIQSLSVTHPEVGKWIGERWGLPEGFRRAIWRHHQFSSDASVHLRSPDAVEQLVYLADFLTRRARIGQAGNSYLQHDDTWVYRRIGFEPEDLSEFSAELVCRVQEIGQDLNLLTPTMQVYLKALQDANRQLANRSLEAEGEAEMAKERALFLQTQSSIAHLPGRLDPEIDVLAKAVDLIRVCLDISWILLVTTDTARQTVQGVLCSPSSKGPQTFYRVLNLVEGRTETSGRGKRSTAELLGETVLANGQRVNLRDEVLNVLQSGNLVAVPMSIDDACHGECLVDSAGSRLHHARQREYFSSLLDTTAKLLERERLFRRVQRETEIATEALQRESEALRQLFHFERLASVGRLAAGAAHEINNPLAVISGKAQLLLMGEQDPSRVASLNAVIDQSMRISKIISDLMGYARPAEPEVADHNLQAMVDNAFYMAQHRLPDHHTETEIDIAEDLATLRVDARQIEQVLVNLFVNAIQAMEGLGKLTVQATHEESTNTVSIQVTDTGPGIPPEDLSRIFDPFFTTKREGEGTGLGLAVSHRIVESHGGRLTVASRVGQGTTFTLQLPYTAEGQGEVVRMPKSKIRKAGLRSGKKRVLLVDDERQLSDLIRDFLRDAGYVVEQAWDGVEAMGYLETKTYDLLILDIRMPRKDGLEVLEELRSFTTGLPILIITGLASNEEIDQAAAFGAERFLRKPFQLTELLHAVDDLTKRRSTNHLD